MVPKVQVPMDFGVKYLGSPSHGNLKFRLKDKEEIPANSMIISYNSPVIESLTTDLLQTSIDVDDFCKDAVQCILESCYSGKLQKITRTNFRDANKMSKVFEVSWLVKRCFEYFEKLVDEVDTNSYDDQLFLFEEAMFMWVTLKNRNFVEVVIKKFSSEIVKCDTFFVSQYLSDLNSRTTNKLDVVIEMVAEQKQVLMKILNNTVKGNRDTLDRNARYLLENVSFRACRSTHKALYEDMFEYLRAVKTPSTEDFRLMLELFKQSESSSPSAITICCQDYASIPNCRFPKFQSLKSLPNLVKLMEFLASFPLLNNSYIFLDAVYCWILEHYDISISEANITKFVDKFMQIILERGWKPLAPEYLAGKTQTLRAESDTTRCMTSLIKKLETKPTSENDKNYSRVLSVDDYCPQDFFQHDKYVKFFLKHPETEKCDNIEQCGFILRVTGIFGNVDDTFDIQVVVDPNYYQGDIHFHSECINVANMHVALAVDKDMMDYPISWSGRPCRDGTDKYYVWGQHRFYKKEEGASPKTYHHRFIWLHGSDARLRLVVYYLR
jgi:hypothetical protein